MNVLVCVKRVPQTGGRIVLTADGQAIDTKFLGFTISPHEECGVEEAVRIVEAQGGSSVVLTLGPAEAEDQLRDAMALGIDRAILLEIEGREWDPVSTAGAIAEAIVAHEAANGPFDLIIVGNEAADTGDFQVGVRIAVALGRPIANGIKGLAFHDGLVAARREAPTGGWETYELPLPAVVGVKEGLNLPRYPSVPGRLRAKKKEVERIALGGSPSGALGLGAGEDAALDGDRVVPGPSMLRLRLPAAEHTTAEVIGRGPEAAPAVVDLLERIGVLAS
ncbi:MAG TPA: electron transfer flavoprotein subunit beta/FixA family protein [Candidatus Limnocylindrales bacterium]|nr:electron transfer flavoprotein subunit beta/FixA family protein [Candidatus Limnocylindrales bacterium]